MMSLAAAAILSLKRALPLDMSGASNTQEGNSRRSDILLPITVVSLGVG